MNFAIAILVAINFVFLCAILIFNIMMYRSKVLDLHIAMMIPQLTVNAREPGIVQIGDTFTFADRQVTVMLRNKNITYPAEYVGEYIVVGKNGDTSECMLNGMIRLLPTSSQQDDHPDSMFFIKGVTRRDIITDAKNNIIRNDLVSTSVSVSGGSGIFHGASGTWSPTQVNSSEEHAKIIANVRITLY